MQQMNFCYFDENIEIHLRSSSTSRSVTLVIGNGDRVLIYFLSFDEKFQQNIFFKTRERTKNVVFFLFSSTNKP